MSPENFCYWLQGLIEVGKPKTLDESQVEQLRQHLALVLTNVTGLKSLQPIGPTGPTC